MNRRIVSIVLGAAFLGACFATRETEENTYVFQIVATAENRSVFETSIAPGDAFEITYVHSVSRSRVTGFFHVTVDGGIQPVGTQFSAYGPGLPWAAERYESRPDGSMFVLQTDEPVRDELRIWVSGTTADFLTVHGKTISLVAEGGAPRLIVIRVNR